MSKVFVLAIRDRSADVFGRPMFEPSKGRAIRQFSDEINRKAEDNVMYKHPEDFDLFELGSYDDEEGSFETVKPRQLCVGKDVRVDK